VRRTGVDSRSGLDVVLNQPKKGMLRYMRVLNGWRSTC
jgi:hypothetical protein